MPRALPAALRRGTTTRTSSSSTIVLTSTSRVRAKRRSVSQREELLEDLRQIDPPDVHHQPAFLRRQARRNINARLSILDRFHSSAYAAMLATSGRALQRLGEDQGLCPQRTAGLGHPRSRRPASAVTTSVAPETRHSPRPRVARLFVVPPLPWQSASANP